METHADLGQDADLCTKESVINMRQTETVGMVTIVSLVTIMSGRCKREESGECTFGGRCWYGHIWNTHRSDFDTYNRRTSEKHAEARSRSSYDNHNSMHNRAGDERRNQEQPSHWNSSVQNQLDQYNYTSSGSNNNAGTLEKIGNQLTILVKQMSGQQNG